MKNMINSAYLEGYLYEHDLKIKVTGENSKKPGTQFITGTISIATDNDCVNIVSTHFSYVVATIAKGNKNNTFYVLNDIIDGKIGSIMEHGKENAGKLKVETAIGLNDFYTDRSGKEELVSAKRYEGGFVTVLSSLNEDEKQRNVFTCDMIITGAFRKEADEEKKIPEKMTLKGAIFDFKKALLPVEFSVVNPRAMDYFEGLEPSPKNPILTKVQGRQISETIVKVQIEESAFGEDMVKETKSTHKDYVIFNASKTIQDWNTEETITADELTKAMAEREVYLATIKQRQDEYKASKNKSSQNNGFTPSAGEFKF